MMDIEFASIFFKKNVGSFDFVLPAESRNNRVHQ